jgi:DNA-binding NtrC family response regulator
MARYSWPGNVRELKNIVERAMVLSKSTAIAIDMLPKEILGTCHDMTDGRQSSAMSGLHRKTLMDVEREHILDVLRSEGNNRTAAAKVLGISRSTLQDKLKRYGMT